MDCDSLERLKVKHVTIYVWLLVYDDPGAVIGQS